MLRTMRYATRLICIACFAWSSAAGAAPVVPASDDQVIETLPARLAGQPVTVREALAQEKRDPIEAAALARRYLAEARDRGDPRYAGYASAAIAPWKSNPNASSAIAVLDATIAQYQHDFDRARKILSRVLAREPANAQAVLTLATIDRVQGRYADSDRSCRAVPARLYAAACLAENMALRGETDRARKVVQGLLAASTASGERSADIERWLLTTLAELEERAGQADAAESAFRAGLALGRDSYLVLDYADFLLAHDRAQEAASLLAKEPTPYGDGVLLRLAIAHRAMKKPDSEALVADLKARFDAARERGDAISVHGRELSRFDLVLQGDVKSALAVARDNLKIQKEPADFLVMAEAARAANDAAALAETAALAKNIGLVDTRLAALVTSSAGN